MFEVSLLHLYFSVAASVLKKLFKRLLYLYFSKPSCGNPSVSKTADCNVGREVLRIITISSSQSCDFKTLAQITKYSAKDFDALPLVYIFIYRTLICSLAEVIEKKCKAEDFNKIVL